MAVNTVAFGVLTPEAESWLNRQEDLQLPTPPPAPRFGLNALKPKRLRAADPRQAELAKIMAREREVVEARMAEDRKRRPMGPPEWEQAKLPIAVRMRERG